MASSSSDDERDADQSEGADQTEGHERPDRRYARVPTHTAGGRLDRFLAEHFPQYSRRQLGDAVRAGHVRINGKRGKPGILLAPGDRLELPIWSQVIPEMEAARDKARPAGPTGPIETVPELYRDDDVLVIDKPAGVPVHAGAGWEHRKTIIDLLKEDILADFGLVHRLDLNTTGALLLVRGADLRAQVTKQFADPDAPIQKTYEAITSGAPEEDEGVISLPLRPPPHKGRAEVDREDGRAAITEFTVVERFTRAARLRVQLKTGRTHQIRAHLRAIGFPLLVDPLYGRRKSLRIAPSPPDAVIHLRRTPLHAAELKFPHPVTGETLHIKSPTPTDMRDLLEHLRKITAHGSKRGGLPPVWDAQHTEEE